MARLTEVPDERLLKLMRGGSEDAFTALYRRRQGAIYRFALEMSGSTSVAEEVTQEVFMVLIQDRHGYDPSRGSLAAFLLGVARHLVLRSLKRDRQLVSIENGAGDSEDFAPVSLDDPHSAMSRQESIYSVQQAVLSLPGHYREAVVLCDLNELSYEEAASVLECSVGTVRSRLHRGRALLMQKLTGRRKVEASGKALDPSRCPA
jgi:RNA polymerase sigma-70 factor (ECF subfamily)